MSDIQKWQASINYLYPVNDETPMHSGRMEVILYADHVKAVKAAEQRGFHRGWRTAEAYWRKVSIRYGRRKVQECRDAVAALMSPPSDKDPTPLDFAIYEEVLPVIDALAAIDALRGAE